MSVAQLTAGRRRPVVLSRLAATGPVATLAATVAAALVLVAILAPLISPHDPNAVDPLHVFAPSSGAHPLGTDDIGRDVLSRLIWGARPSLAGPAVVILLSSAIGTLVALVAGWFGGLLDAVVSRALDILFAFPGLILAVIAAAIFGPGFLAPVIALSISYVPVIARVMRAAVIRERNLPYVAALRIQGSSGLSISLRHILVNIAPLVLVQSAIGFGYAMLDLSAIAYVGLGIQPPTADWGVMAAEGQPAILDGHPQQSIDAALIIVVAVVAFNLVGERLARHFELGDVR